MSVIVFVPSFIHDENSGFLFGSAHSYTDNQSEIKVIVVHGKLQEDVHKENLESSNIVGYFHSGHLSRSKFSSQKRDWVTLTLSIEQNNFSLKDAQIDGLTIQTDQCRLVVYDKDSFLKSELLSNQIESMRLDEIYNNHFLILLFSLKKASKVINPNPPPQVVLTLLYIFQSVLLYSAKLLPVLKFSTLGLHFHKSFFNMAWAMSSLSGKGLNLKVGNYILSVLLDIILGTFVLQFLQDFYAMPEFFELMGNLSQDLVVSLKRLIEWLMGSPAGLKLNSPLNCVLGKFFLYHIDLWWFFLGLVRPFLEFGFHLLLLIGRVGEKFQTAILADIPPLASFHVYCIYVHAARLYNLQLNGLASLSRLFIGCKRNPLPGKVDSCPYTTEQLFVGTIAFTVLLFLLPTTLVYYVVFTALRLFVIVIGGILTRGRFLLQSLPLYVFAVWLLNPAVVTSSFEIVPKIGSLVLYVQPICCSVWKIIKDCIPDPIERPADVEWRKLTRNLIMGNLIYPM
ncbi:hypothetical protein LSTR_LSTR002599 [Laodelphax striatellus]|uniref:Phosphatidylinositol N-acetylglucosaminyltransferase subunit Q n=1 Tax=Laodelphax striatellus TaxID=195883 RepID=A0A482XLD2_LAOST|nr:hypothetical protein LSTR_LSTR002599 [Laodelphax striatellus]